LALGGLVVIGLPAFVIGGRYWVSEVSPPDAVARFRSAGASAAQPVAGLPEPGVYRYRTTGGERVSFLDHHRSYSPTTVRIVTRRGCGVREEQRFLVQHLEYYDRCGDRLVSYGTDIAYWWTHGTQDFRCDGGSFDGRAMRPGEESDWHCADEDTRADQTTTYVGDETVVVDGRELLARHTKWSTQFSGATQGSAVVDDWFDATTGLVLREERNIGLKVGSAFVGDVTYIDISSYTLLSAKPLT
jgi:hypothetical protein